MKARPWILSAVLDCVNSSLRGIIALFFFPVVAYALVVSGYVEDQNGDGVIGASVCFWDESTGLLTGMDATDSTGAFRVLLSPTYCAEEGTEVWTFAMSPVYPNPSSGTVALPFSLPSPWSVQIDIYNLIGQRIREVFFGELNKGPHVVLWDGRDDQGRTMASGMYLAILRVGERVAVQRVLRTGGAGEASGIVRPKAILSQFGGLYTLEVSGSGIETLRITHLSVRVDTCLALRVIRLPLTLSLDREYEWYRDQRGTGYAANNNCGPASVSMAIAYHLGEDVPAAEVRELSPREGGWWYTSDIHKALSYYGVPYAVLALEEPNDLIYALDRGHVLLVCVKMGEISYNPDPKSRFGRFYTYSSGHFLILKGYFTDGEGVEWIMVYDSNNLGRTYLDGTPKGKDRYYMKEEVYLAMEVWWPYYFEIGATPILAKRLVAPDVRAGPEP